MKLLCIVVCILYLLVVKFETHNDSKSFGPQYFGVPLYVIRNKRRQQTMDTTFATADLPLIEK